VTFSVYAYMDGDRVVYVGCTGNMRQRQTGHRRSSWWTPDLQMVELANAESRGEALNLERLAIREHRPQYNRYHNTSKASAA
jgi:excinuclease UvrABC nuclease subunit